MNQRRTTLGKALFINQDPNLYGTFAEIGAGQEVARYFFQAGKASQTIAKTISAYDMIFSDEIYGREANGRYVCESRLNKMLQKEFDLLPERLDKTRGSNTHFFSFASTVATGSESHRFCHGWIGLRFQIQPHSPVSNVVMHVRMLDRHRLQQQEILGILGVNLMFAAFFHRQSPDDFINILVEDIKEGRLSIDLIRFNGPAFHHFDDLMVNLELVRRNLCDAMLFGPKHDLLFGGDVLFQKSLIVERATFAPPTNTHLEIIHKAEIQSHRETHHNPVIICELCLPEAESFNPQLSLTEDLRHRIKMINALGYHALISRFPLYFQLKSFLRLHTKESIHFVVNATLLEKLFALKFYQNLEGGLLEGLALLLDHKTNLYVYPHKDDLQCVTMNTFSISGPEQKILEYFKEKGWLRELGDCELAQLSYHSIDIRKRLQENQDISKQVPASVLKYISTHKLYQ